MQTLDFNLYFGIDIYNTAEDEATDIDVSDSLYKKLKEIYQEYGEESVNDILDDEENEYSLTKEQKEELQRIFDDTREELIDVQHYNGNDTDPDTGEAYNFDSMMFDMTIIIPTEWDEEG